MEKNYFKIEQSLGKKIKTNNEIVIECFYIQYFGDDIDNSGDCDAFLAKLIQLTRTKFRKVMKDKFNAFQTKTSREIYFGKIEDAELAVNWIESRLIMTKLSNKPKL